MNKIQFENLLKPLVEIYNDIELDIIKNILRRITNYDGAQGSLKWYLEKLADLGAFDLENSKIIKKNKKEIEKIIKEISTTCGHNVNDLDTLVEYYDKGLININPNELYKSTSINNLIQEAFKDTNNIMELINTKAIEGAQSSYKNILNKAYLETAGGMYTYTESIRRSLNEMAKNGIQTVHYESGRTLSIESVVRRDVVTRMNKLVGDVELQHAKELETNLVYVDQHLGARIRTKYTKHDYEAHAEWQGKKYMIEGSSKKYPNLYEKTGYGEMLGLKGINCYHDMRPTWEWEKISDRIDEVENAIAYEKLQKQREYERKSKEVKRMKAIAKDLEDKEGLKKLNNRQKVLNEKYDTWLKENNLTRDYNREYITKPNNTLVFEDEYFKEFDNLNKEKEHLIYYDLETSKIIGNISTGTNYHVQPDSKTRLKLLFAKKDSVIAVHNHPSNLSFSLIDFKTFNNSKELKGIAVRTDEYIYLLSSGKGSKIEATLNNMKLMDNIFNNIQKEMSITPKTKTINNIHERNKRFAKEMGWKYERIKNQRDD